MGEDIINECFYGWPLGGARENMLICLDEILNLYHCGDMDGLRTMILGFHEDLV